MATDIEELVSKQSGNGSTVATTSNTEEPTIQLESWIKDILITAANPYYQRTVKNHIMDILSISKFNYDSSMRSVRRKLHVSGTYPIFSALCIALKDGTVTIEEVLEGKNLAEELPKFKVSLRKLTRAQKRILAGYYNHTIEYRGFTHEEIADSLQYTYSGLASSMTQGGRGLTLYQKLGIHNHAQLAFFAHIYIHFMHNQVEEQLTGHQLDTLEALVVKTDRMGVYNFNPKSILNSPIYESTKLVRQQFGVQTSMDAVLKALDLGYYNLLLDADTLALVNLDPTDIDFLKTRSDPVAIGRNGSRRTRIYGRLDIHNQTQLAPYIFLATKLEEHEMDALRSAHASPDQDPMQIIYEKFNMPEHSALLAPSKYLAAKNEMATKNS